MAPHKRRFPDRRDHAKDSIQASRLSQEGDDQFLDEVELLGQILFKLGKLSEAEQMHIRALNRRKHAIGENSIEVLRSKGELAQTYIEQGRLKEPEDRMVEVLKARRTQCARFNGETVTSLESLASL